MKFFAPALSSDERASAPFGLAERAPCFNLLKLNGKLHSVSFDPGLSRGRRREAAFGHKTMDRCGQRQPDCRNCAEPLHRCVNDQRNSGGDRPFCVGGRQRYLCACKRFSSGRNPDSHVDPGDGRRGGESGGRVLDSAPALAAFRPVAQARDEPKGKALGETADRDGDPHPDSRRAGDVDAPDGAPYGDPIAEGTAIELDGIKNAI